MSRSNIAWAALIALLVAVPIGFLSYGGWNEPGPLPEGELPVRMAPGRVGFAKFTGSVEQIGALVATYAIVALLIERFVMIFLLPDDLEERRRQQAVAAGAERQREAFQAATAAQYREASVAAAALSAAPPEAAQAFSQAEVRAEATARAAAAASSVEENARRLAQEELIRHSRKFAIWALVCGIVLAGLGFRIFGQIATASVPSGTQNTFWPEALFFTADILLSGVLLAGGSQGIHSAIDAIAKRTM